MARLTKEEQEAFDRLQARLDEPENQRSERVDIRVDLSDEQAVKRAVRAGILPESYLEDDGEEGEEGEEGEGEGEGAKPRRRKPASDEPAPRRRLSGADRWAE